MPFHKMMPRCFKLLTLKMNNHGEEILYFDFVYYITQ